MNKHSKQILVLIAGFVVGLFLLFPWNMVKSRISSLASGTAGVDLAIGTMSGTTGFRVGLAKGSLFGVMAEKVEVAHPALAAPVQCSKLIFAPKILPFFWGQLQVGFRCQMTAAAEISGLLKAKPFWSLTSISVDLSAEDIPLKTVDQYIGEVGLDGVLNGDIEVIGLSARASSFPKQVTWDLKVQDLQTPGLNHSFAKLPGLSFSELTSEGSFEPQRVQIRQLNFGSAANPVEGQFKIDFGLNSRLQPVSGDWTGNLRVDPAFEEAKFKDINLSLLFGKAQDGKRSFRKVVEGSFLSLLRPPES